MNEELRRVHAELESARSEILARNEEVATTNEELKVIRAELDELAAINRRQNEFLVTLAHELRNPLAVLNSSSEVLGLAKGDAAAVSATQVMMKGQISHMSCMIDDLLDVSRITSGKVELRLEPLDLARLVREYCDSMRAPLEAKGVELSVDLPEHGIVIAGDAVRIEQILGNLLSNATKGKSPRCSASAIRASGCRPMRCRKSSSPSPRPGDPRDRSAGWASASRSCVISSSSTEEPSTHSAKDSAGERVSISGSR